MIGRILRPIWIRMGLFRIGREKVYSPQSTEKEWKWIHPLSPGIGTCQGVANWLQEANSSH